MLRGTERSKVEVVVPEDEEEEKLRVTFNNSAYQFLLKHKQEQHLT